MKSKGNQAKKSSFSQNKATNSDSLWLLGNINAVVKISRAILNLDKAILNARQEVIPIITAKKALLDTANTYLFMSRDILANISSNSDSNSIPSINVEEPSHSVRTLIRGADTMSIYALSDIDYAKNSIYSALETLSSRKVNLRADFKKCIQYLTLANQFILIGMQCNIPRDM